MAQAPIQLPSTYNAPQPSNPGKTLSYTKEKTKQELFKAIDEQNIRHGGWQKKVQDQQKQVDLAQAQVDAATKELFQRKKDLEKLEIHKGEWQKEVHYWTEQKESLEHDEQGSATHMIRKADKKRRLH